MISFLISFLIVSIAGYFFIQHMQQRLNKEFKKRTFELEEKMKQSEESDHKIKLIIENLNEAVVAIHPDLRIVFHNQPFQSLLGGEKIVAKHSSFLEIVRNVELNQMLERVLQNKTSEKKNHGINGEFQKTHL